MLEKLGIKSRWDLVPAVLSVLLYINFLVFVILLFAATGVLFLYAAPSILTSALLIAAIIAHLITRHRSCKLWRRLLLGAIGANFLIIAAFIVIGVVMVFSWLDVMKEIKTNG